MYFFVIVFAAVYWIIYGNWIGGCLMASLFLVLIYSIRRCKREEKQLELKIKIPDWVVIQGEKIKIVLEITGIDSWNNDYIFEIEYEIEAKLYGTKKRKKQKIRWNPQSQNSVEFIESAAECDNYILRVESIAWEDLTGIYKAKKKCKQEIRFLVMPVSYELETMNKQSESKDLCEQGFEYEGVRNYHEGDRISRIHWNLYASTRKFLVRDGQNENESEEYIKIGIDLSEPAPDRISDYLSVFYSISQFYMKTGFWQEIYYGTHCFLLKDMEQYEELFTDIFNEGLQELSGEISGVQKIVLNEKVHDIQKYLYDMEL